MPHTLDTEYESIREAYCDGLQRAAQKYLFEQILARACKDKKARGEWRLDLAEIVGRDVSTFNKYASGVLKIPLSKLLAITTHLRKDVSDFKWVSWNKLVRTGYYHALEYTRQEIVRRPGEREMSHDDYVCLLALDEHLKDWVNAKKDASQRSAVVTKISDWLLQQRNKTIHLSYDGLKTIDTEWFVPWQKCCKALKPTWKLPD